jgi:hypothetical protein
MFNSNYDKTHPFSDTGAMIQLAASVAVTWTVPGVSTRKYRAEFSFNSDDYVWVAYNKTAVIPTPGASVDTNQQELRPEPKYVFGGNTLSFISTENNVQCGVTLMEVPSPS